MEDNLRFLRRQTGVHVHADLIAGLPGETLESFAAGFDRLVCLGPQEIQVGILKRLRGTPIVRHDQSWQMVYSSHPPYEILRNKLMDFALMQRLRRFARYWDLTGNSGNFVETTPMLWNGNLSPFAAFMKWSEWLYARIGRRHAIALERLANMLFEYLTVDLGLPATEVAQSLWSDWQRAGRREKPEFLAGYVSDTRAKTVHSATTVPRRQARHLGLIIKN
jgi:ribonuclease BN (tRNA processing enzyme)